MRFFVLLAAICCSLSTSAKDDTRRTNIVLILVDDLAWSDLGCYGHAYHRTPNIDRLASEGLRFTNGYAPAPICSASRASILTGKPPARLGFEFVTKNESGYQQLDTDVPLRTPEFTLNLPTQEITIAERLAKVGYQTAFFGKWHVNQHFQRRYLAWHPEFGPQTQGFATAVEDFGDHPYAWRKKKPPGDLPSGQFPNDSMINRTAEFIRRQSDSRSPYFLLVSTFYVHTPVKNRCRWLVEKYDHSLGDDAPNRNKRLEYAAFVETLDHHIGTILDAVDDSNQSDNTLVFFLSDNGGHPEFCSNAPLRGSKWNLYEGGIRVPMIARWPKNIRANTTHEAPVIGYDLLPTFADVAGAPSESHHGIIDGVSLRDAFDDPTWQPERSLIWHFPYYHPETTYSKAIETIGISDFAISKTRPQSAIRRGNDKLIHFAEDDRVELYDLGDDVGEQNDLSELRADVATELGSLLEQQLNEMDARRAVAVD
ncbi:MAG: sulfatase [Planctomycetota bacterium]